jgi:hypothetical protein
VSALGPSANSDLLYHSGTGKVSILKKQYDGMSPAGGPLHPNRKEVLNKIHEEPNVGTTTANQSSILADDYQDRLHHTSSSPNFFSKDFMLKHAPLPKNRVRITSSNCRAITSLRNDIGVLKTTTMDIPVDDTQALLQLNF